MFARQLPAPLTVPRQRCGCGPLTANSPAQNPPDKRTTASPPPPTTTTVTTTAAAAAAATTAALTAHPGPPPVGANSNVLRLDRVDARKHLRRRHPSAVREHVPPDLLDRRGERVQLHQHVRLELRSACAFASKRRLARVKNRSTRHVTRHRQATSSYTASSGGLNRPRSRTWRSWRTCHQAPTSGTESTGVPGYITCTGATKFATTLVVCTGSVP